MKDYNLEFRKMCADDAMKNGVVDYMKNLNAIVEMLQKDYVENLKKSRIQDIFPPHDIVWKPELNKKVAIWTEIFEIK